MTNLELFTLQSALDEIARKRRLVPEKIDTKIEGERMTNETGANSAASRLDQLRTEAQHTLRAAEAAWYAYYGECEVGPLRVWAAEVYDRIRRVKCPE